MLYHNYQLLIKLQEPHTFICKIADFLTCFTLLHNGDNCYCTEFCVNFLGPFKNIFSEFYIK